MSAAEQLREHFCKVTPQEQASGWEALWQKKVTPWDRSAPNPALVDALKEQGDLLSKGTATKRKRALVPGCGTGYDVLLLASHGYDAFGLDTAPSAIQAAERLKQQNQNEPGQYAVQDEKLGAGGASFLLANFFEDDWLAKAGGDTFDLIYDFTFLCALHPDMRPAWSKRMTDLLAADGKLICLEFPLGKPPASGGPPHGLTSQLYVELFKEPGKEVTYSKDGTALDTSSNSSSGLSRVRHWKPVRSHHAAQGNDMVSIWQHTAAGEHK